MPMLPKQPCRSPGCGNLVERGYCPAHAQEDPARLRSKRRAQEQREYKTARWQRLRLVVLSRDAVCVLCNELPSTIVDHIKPVRDGGRMYPPIEELRGLCKSCHDGEVQRRNARDRAAAMERKP